MRDYFFPVTVVFVLLCNGCFAFGTNSDYHPFDAEVLASIQPGTTKTADVAELFGAPTRVVKLSNGNAYVYQRSVAKATLIWLVIVTFGNYDTQTDQVVFFFDNDDTLTHYGVSMNADKAGYGLPF